MRNDSTNRNIKKANRINRHDSWFVRTLSASSPIAHIINFKLLPPPQCINDCNNNIPADEQTNIYSVRQSFIAPGRSLFRMEDVWAILFAKGGIFYPQVY